MQVPRYRRDVRVAHEALHDVDVLSPAHEARSVAVTPPVRMPTGHARRVPAAGIAVCPVNTSSCRYLRHPKARIAGRTVGPWPSDANPLHIEMS